ncbi:MAG TPA: TraR/DksA family transcriptional regulator [Steroidobacter sp.]|uniref:TraR/DksA family transcriptional regulator n=1 Tax=Steroidobacter sp. TaxID=1978227 RepID=UPI002EDAED26
MVDQTQALDFKLRLRERAAQLRDELQRTRAKSVDETPGNVAERARDSEDDSFATLIVDTNLSEIERDVDELRMIDSALQRINAGTYGNCVDCGQSIPFARLRAEPTAERCVQCQELYEKTHVSARTPSL